MGEKIHPYKLGREKLRVAKTKEQKQEARKLMRDNHPWKKHEGNVYKDERGRWYEIRVDGHRRRKDLEAQEAKKGK